MPVSATDKSYDTNYSQFRQSNKLDVTCRVEAISLSYLQGIGRSRPSWLLEESELGLWFWVPLSLFFNILNINRHIFICRAHYWMQCPKMCMGASLPSIIAMGALLPCAPLQFIQSVTVTCGIFNIKIWSMWQYSVIYLTDIDECTLNISTCASRNDGGSCTNTAGSYLCHCLPGYSGNGHRCIGKLFCQCLHGYYSNNCQNVGA